MAKGVYSSDGSMKLCRGALHKGADGKGTMVPLRDFNFHKSGRLEGRPFYACRQCWNVLRGRPPEAGLIDTTYVLPVLQRFVDLVGNLKTVAEITGLRYEWLWSIKLYPKVKLAHFTQLSTCLAEYERRNSDAHNKGEAEVVEGEILSQHLRKWVREYLADRPLNVKHMGDGETGTPFMGPLDVLAQRTEINVRRVQGIVNGEFEYVGLSQADALLTAAGVGYKTQTGEISVIPNPNWTIEKWQRYMINHGA